MLKLSRAIAAAALAAFPLGHVAAQHQDDGPKGFVFSGMGVKSLKDENQAVDVKRRYSLLELADKLLYYRITLSMECDGFCLLVSQGEKQPIQLYWDDDRAGISMITSYDPNARDVLGNKIGDGLGRTIGAQPVHCDVGESVFCESRAVRGLWYVPSSTADCNVEEVDAKRSLYSVPSCVTIDGFAVRKSAEPEPRAKPNRR